jgi:hypothetical protein
MLKKICVCVCVCVCVSVRRTWRIPRKLPKTGWKKIKMYKIGKCDSLILTNKGSIGKENLI